MFGERQSIAVVVAHCDDESLWAGGLLSRFGERCTVIACSIPRSDPVRAWKFFAACDVFGAKARLLPFTETDAARPLNSLEALDLDAFDCIVTHGAAGEYGHQQHRSLSAFVRGRWPDKTWGFGWRPDGRGALALYATRDEQERRLAALKCYDHVSPHDGGKPKWKALLDCYPVDLRVETHDPPDA